ncbi:MAG: beta strand repeat-containing protein [Bacteroidota bacterium]
MKYLLIIAALFCSLPQISAQNNIAYGAGISYTNGAPSFVPPARTSRVAIDTVTGKWYHYNTPGGWQLLGNTIEEIAGCTTPAYTPTKGDSKVVINNCTTPEVYFYNGSTWVQIGSGSTLAAGEGIRIENDTIILDSLNYLQFRTGSALDGSVGRVQWNDTDGTLTLLLKGGNVTLQIGEKEVSLVKHADNTGLTEGKVVYIVGADGTNKTVRYALATADATSATTFGLMAESATGGNKAFCTTFGLVRNLNTTNLTEGDIVWLSADTAGAMTAVRPTAPKHGVMIGFCVRKHATQGAIFVQVQNGYELNELHDVFVPNPINNQILTWDNIDKRWEAKTVADSSATNELQTLSVAANTATLSSGGGSVTIAGAGINTVGTAGTTITVTGTEVDGSVSNELQTLSTGTNTLTLSNGGGTVTVDTDPASDVIGSGASGQVSFWTGTQTQAGDNAFVWDNTNKRLGVGASVANTGTFNVRGATTSTSTWTAQFHNSAGNNNALMVRDDGNVGIGTNAPGTRLAVDGTVGFENSSTSFDGGILSADLSSTGSGTNWTGTSFSSGYTHTVGSTAPLIGVFAPTIGFVYQVQYTVTGRTAGSFTFTFGGYTSGAISTNVTDVNVSETASTNGVLTITPTSTFNGTVVFIIRRITSGSATFTGRRSDGTIVFEQRYSSINSNIFMGISAGGFNTTGTTNIFQGFQAGSINTTGSGNIFYGYRAGYVNTTGSFNIFEGYEAGSSNTTGSNNVIQGYQAGRNNTTGIENVFQGRSAGFSNTTGNYNMFQGRSSGTANTTGSDNIFKGFGAGGSNKTGSRNIAIGTSAGTYFGATGVNPDTLMNNSILIGYDTRNLGTSQTNQIVIGYQTVGLGSNTTRIGNTSTTQTHLDGSLTLGDATLDASAVLDISSTTRGVLFPRMTTAQRDLITTPADGLVIYNTTANKLQVRAAGVWVDLH